MPRPQRRLPKPRRLATPSQLQLLEVPLVQRYLAQPWTEIHLEFALIYLSNSETRTGQKEYFDNTPELEGCVDNSVTWWNSQGPNDAGRINALKTLRSELEVRWASFDATALESAAGFAREFREFFGIKVVQFELFLTYCLAGEHLCWRMFEDREGLDFTDIARDVCGLTPQAFQREVFSPLGELQTVGLLSTRRNHLGGERRVEVYAEASRALKFGFLGDFGLEATEEVRECLFPLESFPIKPIQIALLKTLLTGQGDARILFHGAPGAGKSSLAARIAQECGVSVRTFRPEHQWDEALTHLAVASRSLGRCGGALIIDEADQLLNTQGGFFRSPFDKGEVNRFLDQLKGRVIFIANHLQRLDPSTLRRFDLVIGFEDPSQSRLLELWTAEIARHGLGDAVPPRQVQRLARTYRTNLGIVSQTASLVAKLPPEVLAAHEVGSVVETILEGHQTLHGPRTEAPASEAELYDLEVLNTSVPARQLQEAARRSQASPEGPGLKLLFHGITGGGKSQLARFLADDLQLPLVVKQASDLLGSFVGETERNIRLAFDQARGDNAVLVIDEADSFLQARQSGGRRWETSMVNEFLTNIESYRGILVVSTNLLDSLDSALLRRFAFKVEFKALTNEGKLRLLQRYFPQVEAGSVEWETLGPLTPGDFATVKTRLHWTPEVDVLQALGEESKARGRATGQSQRVGF